MPKIGSKTPGPIGRKGNSQIDASRKEKGLPTRTEQLAMRNQMTNFAAKFPANAKSWSQASDELATIYHEMNEYNSDLGRSEYRTVSRSEYNTPGERNALYHKLIETEMARDTGGDMTQYIHGQRKAWVGKEPKTLTKEARAIRGAAAGAARTKEEAREMRNEGNGGDREYQRDELGRFA